MVALVGTSLRAPAFILAADHRARGIITVEPYRKLLDALSLALPHADGILATAQPLRDLVDSGAVAARHRTYLSINRTGLAGSAFELDDRLVAPVAQAARTGCTGVKHMTRIDLSDPITASALELLGRVVEEAAVADLDALIEPLLWREGSVARDVDSIILAAVIAHDIGAPFIKVPVPQAAPGSDRRHAVARIVASVGVPVLFLGGPREQTSGPQLLEVVRDVMAGGGSGMAVGRAIYQDDDPGALAAAVAEVVHGR